MTASNEPRRRRHRHDDERGIQRALALPLAFASAVAVTLGIVPPAHGAPDVQKRPTKSSIKHARATTAPAAASMSTPVEYVVVDGDTVSGIAERFGLATADVLTRNGLGWSSAIFPGQRLSLGVASAETRTSLRHELTRHRVVDGDTIIGIANAYGLDTDQVLSINGLDRSSLIFPGQQLVLPSGAVRVDSGSQAAAPSTAPTRTHTVVAGDTLIDIANAHDVDLDELLAANELSASSLIFPGQRLSVPESVSSPTPTGGAAASEPAEALEEAVAKVVELTESMRGNAQIIIDVGRRLGVPDEGVVIALAAAAQESGLRNLDHGDRDSLGVFQQRPSQGWGTRDEVLDPVRAATAFYGGDANPNPGLTHGLLDLDDWQSMSVNDAAQTVQRSGFPSHYGKWEASARAWLLQLG